METRTELKAQFNTTCWTEVLEAAEHVGARHEAAFAELYVAYWHPLYCFARRQGLQRPEAEDLIQGFFTHLLRKHSLSGLEREGGKFRSFLLRCLENFMRIEWRRGQAQKRGGGERPLSLDAQEGESRFLAMADDADTPESAFERQWALTLLENVTSELRQDYAAAGKSELFRLLVKHLQPGRSTQPYAAAAMECGLSEGAFKVAVHRLRNRYGGLLREAISRTVTTPDEIDQELQYLINILGR